MLVKKCMLDKYEVKNKFENWIVIVDDVGV